MSEWENMSRKRLLKLAGATGGALIAGGAQATGLWRWAEGALAPGTAEAAGTRALACVLTPAKTEGPYFVDERLNRSDIRADPADGSVQAGVPLRLTLNVFDADRSCAAVSGATVDIWHANAAGTYSDVAQNGSSGKKYLRGYQVTDGSGAASFTTVYPGWYQGRAIHIHFKVRFFDGSAESYEFTSQLFFDESLNDTVMAQSQYASRGKRTTLNSTDNIYGGDGGKLIPTVTGSPSSGYTAAIDIGVSGLPSSVAKAATGTKVAASLVGTKLDRNAAGTRRLTLTLSLAEQVAADIRVLRGGKTLARKRYAALRAGTRRPTLLLGSGLAGGAATVAVTLKDAAGNAKVVRTAVRIPARR